MCLISKYKSVVWDSITDAPRDVSAVVGTCYLSPHCHNSFIWKKINRECFKGPMAVSKKSIQARISIYKLKSDYIIQISSMTLYTDKLLTDTRYHPR